MLKRLELVGFKSFAEKTQFDFGPGITAIVGPNGSGKSNIVDAVRWILGEQSAKSLRGGEMADVIFNGSASRRSLGFAEVTLTLDNSRRYLDIDADEVQITRRVYRSGEGEYLINKQPTRLRDIKELFLGSGAGGEAYCIIAQGKVEAILQASHRERREIFEEAAGISRFKVKRAETLRKLEHAEQNLLRVRDVLEEVERQARSVRNQAAKAQRYNEYLEELKALRLKLALQEYHLLTQHLDERRRGLEETRQRLAAQASAAAVHETQVQELDAQIAQQERHCRELEASVSSSKQIIAAAGATLHHEWERFAALEEEIHRTRSQVFQMGRQMDALAGALQAIEAESTQAETTCTEQARIAAQTEEALKHLAETHSTLQERLEQQRQLLLDIVQRASRCHNEQMSIESQLRGLEQHRQRLERQLQTAAAQEQELARQASALSDEEKELLARLSRTRESLSQVAARRDQLRQDAEGLAGKLIRLREQRSELLGRIEALEHLERSHEGVGSGVKHLLALWSDPSSGLRTHLLGMLADAIQAEADYAWLIDLALGELSQAFVYSDAEKLQAALHSLEEPLPGRVCFLPLTPEGQLAVPDAPDLEHLARHPGVVGEAGQYVRVVQPQFADLIRLLLGRTWIVRDLDTAMALRRDYRGLRWLTLQGELLEADGRLHAGQASGGGILSRRSELRRLAEQWQRFDDELGRSHAELLQLREQLGQCEETASQLRQQEQELATHAAQLRTRIEQNSQQLAQLAEEIRLSRQEREQLEEEVRRLHLDLACTAQELQATQEQEMRLRADMENAAAELRHQEHCRLEVQQALVAARVAAAKAEERRQAVLSRLNQTRQQYQELSARCHRGEAHLRQLQDKLRDSCSAILRAEMDQASAYSTRQEAQAQLVAAEHRAESLRRRRAETASRLSLHRQELHQLQQQAHAQELEVHDLDHRRAALCDRLREEQDADLTFLHQSYEPPQPPLDAEAVQSQIQDLRSKIARLGSVNLDALEELRSLEERASALRSQVEDLTQAKASLEEIIARINQDSRRLFVDMFEKIRGHFQELFRKLFGGGMADIVLEDPEDVLESGVEIIARPPGKELRSISLLSGGEKTLTAVALLLAIFRSKPSPFCILDEVDAALDEANTGRFAAVLREFTDQSQFIMITHARRTMAMADVLYGVTMQEAGVSKRVAVRLEDWPEQGAA
jgi:chromosome segregation protein